jgi:hypothetical protein
VSSDHRFRPASGTRRATGTPTRRQVAQVDDLAESDVIQYELLHLEAASCFTSGCVDGASGPWRRGPNLSCSGRIAILLPDRDLVAALTRSRMNSFSKEAAFRRRYVSQIARAVVAHGEGSPADHADVDPHPEGRPMGAY